MNCKDISRTYRVIERLRISLAEAVETQRAADALATEAREQFAALVAKSGYSTLQARQFVTLVGDSIECEITRAHSAEQFADHALARARKERQTVEQSLADAVASCRTMADEFGRRRVAEIRREILADASLRARLLEAYGAESLSVAAELGCTGFIDWAGFAEGIFSAMFTSADLGKAARESVCRYLGAAQ